jgi:hypothetical protein
LQSRHHACKPCHDCDRKLPISCAIGTAGFAATMSALIERKPCDSSHRSCRTDCQLPQTCRRGRQEGELVKAAAGKGPKTIATVSETAAKAARRRDVMAARLAKLGVVLPD